MKRRARELYASMATYDLAIEAFDARRIELGLTHEDLDQRVGCGDGLSSSALGPSQTKKLGYESFFRFARELGLDLFVEVNQARTKAIVEGRTLRKENNVRSRNYARRVGIRVFRRVQRELAKRGAAAVNGKRTPEQRKAAARHAALIRWADVKAAAVRGATPCE